MSPPNSLIGRNPSLADVLAQRLTDDIASGQLKPGEKLPAEHQLADTYGVSRPIVREAIGRLKHDGLLVSRQGAGVFVVESGIPSVFRLQVSDFTDRDEIRGIIELLMAIESTATEMAALRRTDEDLAAIQAQLDAMQACIERRSIKGTYTVKNGTIREAVLGDMAEVLPEALADMLADASGSGHMGSANGLGLRDNPWHSDLSQVTGKLGPQIFSPTRL